MTRLFQIGHRLCLSLLVVSLMYAVVVAIGILRFGETPILDPVLLVMEVLTMASALVLVAVMALTYRVTPPGRKRYAVTALISAATMATLTITVHGLALSADRGGAFRAFVWPSTLYAVELVAWDVCLGLSLLAASRAFSGRDFLAARWSLAVSGLLCLVGILGPVLDEMALQRIGIAGYGLGLPVASWFLAQYFQARADSAAVVMSTATDRMT